ncbi:MAG: hypothetical protein ACK5XT_18090 [Gemmatimonas sp.]|jgi:hypothetical protein|uniref:hypothetical protein n=1 Tax=Gemmatimonas sp. TaxID=1962908 RepID=UPI00391F8B4B|nr:hypothetical protein [Gemmatimonadota bacterium]
MMSAVARAWSARFLAARSPLFALVIALPARAQGGPPPELGPPPSLRQAPPVPSTYEGLFAERDARAQSVIGFAGCMQRTMNAARSGALGSVSPSWSIACIQQGKEWRGLLVELKAKDDVVVVQRQWALRGAGMVVREPFDTAAAGTIARAMRRALSAPLPGRGVADFMPIALVQKGYSEVWFLPMPDASTRIVIGGDSLIQMTEDGTRELGHAKFTPRIRVLPPLSAGATSLTLPSREERLPLVSEIVAARLALPKVAEVRIRTATYDAMLSRATGKWTHSAR